MCVVEVRGVQELTQGIMYLCEVAASFQPLPADANDAHAVRKRSLPVVLIQRGKKLAHGKISRASKNHQYLCFH